MTLEVIKRQTAAKSTLDLPRVKVGTDFKCNIFFPFDGWNGAVTNKLHSVKPILGD